MMFSKIIAGVITTPNLPNVSADPSRALPPILGMVFGIAGSISLLMVVIGGFRYILAHGEPSEVTQAKNTILYAIIGLVITTTAFAIVNLVITKVT